MELLFIITSLFALACAGILFHQSKLFWAIVLPWILGLGILSLLDFFQNTDAFPPRMVFVLVIPAIAIVWITKTINVEPLNLKVLTTIHLCRIPVEIVLFYLFQQMLLPEIMTFAGWNFDIIMGITTIPVLWYVFSSKKINKRLLIGWNVTGIALLLFIIILSVLCSPLPIQQLAFDQPNIAMIRFPYIFLPGFVVPAVLLSHLLAIKQLRA